MKQSVICLDLNGVNAYLLPAEGGFVLIDTGGPIVMDKAFTDRRDLLQAELRKAGCERGDLRLLLLTHGDSDHAANAKWVREVYGAPIAMHAADRPLVCAPTLERAMQSYSYRSAAYRAVFFCLRKTIRGATAKMVDAFPAFEPDVLLEDGERLEAYGLRGRVVHLPGHTMGSIAVLLDDGSLVAGDVFANGKKPQTAPNALDFALLDESAAKTRAWGIRTVYPGHGQPFPYAALA